LVAGVDWLEFCVETDSEAVEAVYALMNRHGQGGAVIEVPVDALEHELSSALPPESVRVKTFLPMDGSAETRRQRLEEGLWHLGQIHSIPEPVQTVIPESDWTEAWKKHFRSLSIGCNIRIVPAWDAPPARPESPSEVIISLEPGMAFGTGLHPTTRLCLQALEENVWPGSAVLDVGTGSGILSIAAAKLGAGSVLALDADAVAVRTARENVERNDVADRVSVRQATLPGTDLQRWIPSHWAANGSLDLLETGRYDLVLVNILARVIVGMAQAIAERISSKGSVIVAGLVESQERDVARAFEAQSLRVVGRSQEEDWICLVAQRSG
jgi:ribosomal protein L11 methyltransferase